VASGAGVAFKVTGQGEFTSAYLDTLHAGINFAPGSIFGIDNVNSFTYATVLDGPSGILKLGAGTLTLSGANSYTGGTTLSAGTLQLGANGALGGAGP